MLVTFLCSLLGRLFAINMPPSERASFLGRAAERGQEAAPGGQQHSQHFGSISVTISAAPPIAEGFPSHPTLRILCRIRVTWGLLSYKRVLELHEKVQQLPLVTECLRLVMEQLFSNTGASWVWGTGMNLYRKES